ncbi:MAG: hypothetical protein IJQ99_09730 [Synergistaceae bacterium]|nr:hypothetical protein [Synergistaceae bacterium]
MPRAQTIDRLALTKSRSKYLQTVEEMKKELPPEEIPNYEKCPVCGTKLLHVEGCVKCPNGCFSKCG